MKRVNTRAERAKYSAGESLKRTGARLTRRGQGAAGGSANRARAWMLFPLLIWTALFVLLPMAYVLVLSFSTGNAIKLDYTPTFANYMKLFDADLFGTIFYSLGMSAAATGLALLFGYPFALRMARVNARWKAILMMLVVLPFWTSALMRMFGWRIILRNNGMLNAVLEWLYVSGARALSVFGLADGNAEYERVKFLFTRGAVLFGMTYTMLPFMILPIYSSAEKQDASVREAARDLGASPLITFLTVTLPLSLPGVVSGCVLVFVPSTGLFFINYLLGGGKPFMLGDMIDFFLKDGRDWGMGAVLSVLLIALTFLSMGVYRRASDGGDFGGL